MTPFHGTPITPEAIAALILAGRHAIVSFYNPQQLALIAAICKTFALDNGAFSAWMSGNPILDWTAYYAWVREWGHHPGFAFALIPDVIDGDEDANDELVAEWPLRHAWGVPVWHLHESLDRLNHLCARWHTVALGSSGEYTQIGTRKWWHRMNDVMEVACVNGRPRTKLHGLRMLDPEIFTRIPFASADSTNVARNIGLDQKWTGSYQPPNKAVRGMVLAERIESQNSAATWQGFSSHVGGLFDAEESNEQRPMVEA